MRTSIRVFFSFFLASLALCAQAQVLPAGYEHEARIRVGGFGTMFQTDYAGNGIAQTVPQPTFGVGAYIDIRADRWLTIESEGNWNRFNEYVAYTQPIGEDTYLIGPKVPIKTYGRATPYAKFLIGLGTGTYINGNTTVLAYGGGVDYHLSRRFTLRAIDFEYQEWLLKPQIFPFGGSVGIAYKIF